MVDLSRLVAWTLLATSAASSLATTAHAQGWAKSEAILGGQPSALSAILAQQEGARFSAAATPRIEPASFTKPAVLQGIASNPPSTSPAVTSGQPDVFGSVALKLRTTRLDANWKRIEKAPVGGAAAEFADSVSGRDEIERLEAVNRYVNRRVRFVDDRAQYGRGDVWVAAADTLSRGRGDCEDYAIAKFQMLRRAGIADRDMYLVIVKDLITRGDHAVLVVRAGGRMHVLDNGTEQLLDSEAMRDYRPILTFAANGTWTHGYRVTPAPIAIAVASQTPLVAASEPAPQRSWRASPLAFNTGFSR